MLVIVLARHTISLRIELLKLHILWDHSVTVCKGVHQTASWHSGLPVDHVTDLLLKIFSE